jgi:hypothetical protein
MCNHIKSEEQETLDLSLRSKDGMNLQAVLRKCCFCERFFSEGVVSARA